jgi:transposase
MARRIHLIEHESTEALEHLYRQADDAIERSHLQIIWLLSQGKKAYEVSAVTGYSSLWVGQIAKRYNAGGIAALGDRRQQNAGGTFLLTPEQQSALQTALSGPAPDGGLWSGPKVARWMSEQVGKAVAPQRGWDYLQLLGYTPQVPRRQHVKADTEKQEQFKKNVA